MKTKLLIVVLVSFSFMSISSAGSAAVPDKEFEISITKGAYAIENESYGKAQTYLRKALDIRSDPEALLLMGIALSRDRKYSDAKGYLVDALQQDQGLWRAKFELGVVQYHLGSWEKAADLFEEVRKSDADKHAKSVSKKYLSKMAGPDDKPYKLELYAGWQYDDNVILEPENPSSWSADVSDWRWLAVVDGSFAFLQTSHFRLEAGYMFYHSFHDTLDEFDVEQHRLSLGGAYDPDGPLKVELEYQHNYSKVDGDDYSTINTIGTIFSFTHSPEFQVEKFQTEIHYAHEFQDFEFTDYDDYDKVRASWFNSFRTGDNDVIGLTQKIYLNKNNLLSLDYTYNRKRADRKTEWWSWWGNDFDLWAHDGHKGTVEFTSNINRWQLFFAASYYAKEHDKDIWRFYSSDIYRKDNVQEYTAAITWNPYNWLSISLTENYLINDSNIPDIDYKRNIIGLIVGVGI